MSTEKLKAYRAISGKDMIARDVRDFLVNFNGEMIAKLGSGTHAETYLFKMYDKTYPNELVAVKYIQESASYIDEEIRILDLLKNHCKNNHLLCIYDYFRYEEDVFIVTEYLDGVPLATYTFDTVSNFLNIFKQIVQAVLFLHSMGITHGDIHDSNVMIAKNSAKLIDFGAATYFENETSKFSRSKLNDLEDILKYFKSKIPRGKLQLMDNFSDLINSIKSGSEYEDITPIPNKMEHLFV